DRLELRAEREAAVDVDRAPARLQPDRAARGRGKADRATGIGPEREIAETGGEPGGAPARRAAGRPARVQRVADGSVPRVLAGDVPRELGQARLADDDSAGADQPLHRRRRP